MNCLDLIPWNNIVRPGRYADHELNAARKPWAGAEVRLCLAYPDQYEIGMSNFGLAVLYALVNRLPWGLADRAYLPALDMISCLKEGHRRLWGLETGRPLRDFDLLGISLATELCYTNVLAMLDLAGIPLRSEERSEADPIVLAGGSACANPEPMAPFFDALAIGDGEEMILEIMETLRNNKSRSRRAKLEQLARISGIYVPGIHEPSKDTISARHVQRLKLEYAPNPPLVPLLEVTHDRLTVEIARGCTRGCRFCQAGMIYRPARIRPQAEVLDLVKAGLAASGWEEVSLLSLSSSDYPDFPELLDRVNNICLGQRVAVSVPSLRLDSFDQAMAGCLKRIKRSSLTFAPEAGSQRLRDAINKGLSDSDLLAALELARRNGWQAVKLYFMIGLPTETDQDIQGIVDLCRRAAGIGLSLKVAISPFVPKPQTPFQWEAQPGLEGLEAKIRFLSRNLRLPRLQVHWHDPRSSVLEGVLARGGREVAGLVEAAYGQGAFFDQWSEHFRWDIWQAVLSGAGIDPRADFGARDPDRPWPWAHIDYGVSRRFLLEERDKAYGQQVTPDCRQTGCHGCGAGCVHGNTADEAQQDRTPEALVWRTSSSDDGSIYGRGKRVASQRLTAKTRFRIKYAKGEGLRFISHLDVMRLWYRAIRRANLPVAYSQGFTPHQKLAFGPPLSLGFISQAEYLDLQLEKPYSGDLSLALSRVMNPGIDILKIRPLVVETDSLSQWIDAAKYRLILSEERPSQLGALAEKINYMISKKEPWVFKYIKKGQETEADIHQVIHSLTIINNKELEIIIKVMDKLPKTAVIMDYLMSQFNITCQAMIMRVEQYHIDSHRGLVDPLSQ